MYVRYLNDEDDDVSMAVIPFAVAYVGVLKVCVPTTKLVNYSKLSHDPSHWIT